MKIYLINYKIGPGPGGLTSSAIEAGAKEIVVLEKDLRFISISYNLKY